MTSKHLAKFFANKYQINERQSKKQDPITTKTIGGPESGLLFAPEFNDAIYEIYPSSFNWFGSKRPNVYLSKKTKLIEFNDVFLFNFIMKSLRKYELNWFGLNQSEDIQFMDGIKLLIHSNPTKPTQKMIKLMELIFYQCNSQITILKNLPRVGDEELRWQIFTTKSSLIVSLCLVILNVIAKWRMGNINPEDEIKIQEFRFLAENTIREIDIISKSEIVSKSFKLIQNKKQPAIIQKIVGFLKFIMIERAHQYSSFNQALFFISIFGSRIFPALFKKLSERFMEKPATTTSINGSKKKNTKPITMKDAQFIGFIVGTMFGAGGCASVVSTCLDYLRDKSLGRRLEKTPVNSIILSKSIWMTFGALIGIAINMGARQSIHMAVGKLIQSYLNNPQFIRKVAGKQNELMAKIMVRTFSNMLSKETTKILMPNFNIKPTTQKNNSLEESSGGGFSTMTNDPFIKSLLKDQLSFVNKKNKIAGYLVDNILLGESNILEKPQQVYKAFSNLKSKYTNTLNRIIPAENSVWHYWSTMMALYLSNRFSKQVADQSFEQQESQLYDLNSELREILNAFMARVSSMERASKL